MSVPTSPSDRSSRSPSTKQARLEERLRSALQKSTYQPSIPRRSLETRVPLSYGQEGLWFISQLDARSPVYNRPVALRLVGDVDCAALQRALGEILRRHEILRASFSNEFGNPLLVIHPPQPVELPLVDFSALTEGQREKDTREYAQAQAQRPVDLATAPLLRAVLIRLSSHEHLLLLIFHHIAFDAWSEKVLLNELSQGYGHFANGQAPPPAELAIQYPDFSAWQRKRMEAEEIQDHLSYWQNQLANPPDFELSSDRPRPSAYTSGGARLQVHLSAEINANLRALALQRQSTPSTVFLSAFLTLLFRYTHQEDVLVGMPVAGRSLIELEALIGLLINTLTLRANLAGQPNFGELLGRVQQLVLEAIVHQEIPLEKLVKEFNPKRSSNRSPYFQILFNYKNIPLQPAQFPGLECQAYELEVEAAPYDLSLEVVPRGETVACNFIYSTELFFPDTIERLAANFLQLLQSICQQPDAPIDRLPLLSKRERQQVILEWNDTQAAIPEGQLVQQLFEAQVLRTPDSLALEEAGRGSLTFSELNDRANQLAHYLVERQVRAGSLVALFLERSLSSAVALLGILKAGGTFLALDPHDPDGRLAYILADSGAKVLISEARFRPRLQNFPGFVIYLDQTAQELARLGAQNLDLPLTLETPFYCIYTSGSSGRPKGVLATQRGALNRFAWMWQAFPFLPGEVCCQKTALSFVDCIWEFFGPLLQGVPNIILSHEIVRDVRLLVQALAQKRVSRIVLVPSLLREMLDGCADLEHVLPDLSLWVSSGEALPSELVQKFQRQLPGRRLINLYGSSEVAADVTCYEVTARDASAVRIPIGRPLANTQIFLLDEHLQPVPLGVSAEIFIGGANLALGYHQQPSLTAERFIPNPFYEWMRTQNPAASNKLYRSGDLGRYLPDGNLEILGRIDRQVKIRGVRIEPAEIEMALTSHPSIRQAAVLALPGPNAELYLIAYLVLQEAGSQLEQLQLEQLQLDQLRRFLASRLPDAMIPSVFQVIEALPLTASGKVDRLALAARGDAPEMRLKKSGALFPGRNETETSLCQIWAAILRVEEVGIEDDFFDLGGHSLLATRLAAQVEAQFGKAMPVSIVLLAPTVAKMAAWLEQKQTRSAWPELIVLKAGGNQPPLFCLPGHHGISFPLRELSQLLPAERPVYAIEARTLHHDIPPRRTIQEIAQDSVEIILATCPTPPYYLLGYCVGALVAYEAARQLSALGKEVALVAMIEGKHPQSSAAIYRSPRSLPELMGNVARNLPAWMRRNGWRGVVEGLERHLVAPAAAGISRIRRRPSLPQPAPEPSQLPDIHVRAQNRYQPEVYPGTITLFNAEYNIAFNLPYLWKKWQVDRALGWEGLALGGVNVVELKGDHNSVIRKPYVQELARQLSTLLEDGPTSEGSGLSAADSESRAAGESHG